MQYALCYVSTAAENLSLPEVEELLQTTTEKNNRNQITGILLFSNGNFFQVLEGEKKVVRNLFTVIQEDHRHYDLIPIFHKEIAEPSFNRYEGDFLSLDSTYTKENIQTYLSQVEKLDASIRTSVKYMLQNFS